MFSGGAEGFRQLFDTEVAGAFQPYGHALEELREYDTAVPSGAHQRRTGHSRGHLASVSAFHGLGAANDVSQGEEHVRPGVTIGYGEHVESVDGLDVVLQERRGVGEDRPEVVAV